MIKKTHTRREVLKTFGAAAVLLAAPEAFAEAPLGVGVLYGGSRSDAGYNQAHAEAARTLSSLPGVRLEEIETAADNLPAGADALFGGRGCRILFVPAPGDALPDLLARAAAAPATSFLFCGAPPAKMRLPANVGFYRGFLDEAQHIAGLAAGYATRTKALGMVASRAAPGVLRCVNAFLLGARRADPTVTLRVAFVGADAPPQAVADAARGLVAAGADVLAAQVESGRPVCEVAEDSGVLCCGVHVDLSAAAPKGFLTGAEWSWTRGYRETVSAIAAGKPWPHLREGGFGAGFVRNSAYGAAVSVEARAHADAARMQLANGSAAVFHGPIHDNAGRMVLAKGKSLHGDAPALDRMIWLADGVIEIGS